MVEAQKFPTSNFSFLMSPFEALSINSSISGWRKICLISVLIISLPSISIAALFAFLILEVFIESDYRTGRLSMK